MDWTSVASFFSGPLRDCGPRALSPAGLGGPSCPWLFGDRAMGPWLSSAWAPLAGVGRLSGLVVVNASGPRGTVSTSLMVDLSRPTGSFTSVTPLDRLAFGQWLTGALVTEWVFITLARPTGSLLSAILL